jgi:SWI/SNF-related matrix-associated actin-dependent regulator of chromatin subfamily A-like protein 1
MIIIDYGSELHIKWDYTPQWHQRNLDAVKALPVRRYDPEKKMWIVPVSQKEAVLQLQYSNKARLLIPDALKPEEIGELPPIAELTVDIALKPDVILRPYQGQGIAQGIKFGRCLIGDEQGLGKTLQSIGVMIGLNAFPCLVVCPSSMKGTWKREWEKFSYKKAMVLDSSLGLQARKSWFKYVEAGMADVVIINYESLAAFCVESYPQERSKNGKRKPWKAVDVILKSFMSKFKAGILDESHRCKDSTTNQSKFILRIFNALDYRLLLSGTPVVNKPIDLFPQLAILGKLNEFGGRAGFIDRYCEGGAGANNLKELNYKLNLHCFFRREKKDVAKDLPEKQRQTILCDITTRSEYNRCKADLETFLRDSGCNDEEVARKMRGEIMVQMQKLKQIAGRGKMNEVKEFVNEVLEAGEKLILFCHLHEIVDECKAIWPNAVTVTGRDNMVNRQAHIDAFQNDPKCQLIICNHKAAGVGITLTASSRVAFIEYPWTYADCVQCEDRAHRIGQVSNVMCTYFLGQDTIDERMWEIISTKMLIGNTITGATDMMDSMEMIDKTLSMFKV